MLHRDWLLTIDRAVAVASRCVSIADFTAPLHIKLPASIASAGTHPQQRIQDQAHWAKGDLPLHCRVLTTFRRKNSEPNPLASVAWRGGNCKIGRFCR